MATVLSQQQKDAVKASWAQYQTNGITNGTAFYLSWFKKYPEVFSHFKPLFKDLNINNVDGHPTMRAQVRVFNDAMTSYVDNLDDVELLIILVQKLTKSHVSKGIHIKDFQDAYGHFVTFLKENLHIDGATKDAWEKTVAVLCRIMAEHMQ